MKSDSNIKRVLIDDGLRPDSLIELYDYKYELPMVEQWLKEFGGYKWKKS